MTMALTVDEAIARVPQWANADDLKISPLAGGITNSNFRVDTGGESFALRIAGADTDMLGINREYEYAANLAAGKLGIAPEVIYVIRPEGYLVTRFITARPFPLEEITQPENIRRVIEFIRKIHSMPEIPGTFSVFRTIENYAETARRYNVEFPENFDWLIERMNAAEASLMTDTEPLRPCHNDLLNANFLIDDQIYILDWEYAGMGDVYFDLANFSDHHELSDELDRWLLECYFREVTDKQIAHLKIMKAMSDFREAMWALVQIGISELSFDYRGYANKFFAHVFENISDPHWGQWIKEMKKNG
ncbi:MAG: phosphotransferase family protein [Chloroflexi bacterium]|nr:phosphotransferase family protein [Chloroflexota bacterium]